ncbi:DUF4214 domain-containing protein [Neogemmobacter tilapiae]|uniref:DUF4214 domain-containing protein n=1 Tax=Neogemmobacter tilapiae TaxID=875041 RepID=A0A918TXU5_9RHOB|nr:DUF4214 domain-containing protein [Gemmobacter tilapiae]GHC66443.1 hypothetical protein GCM10007315_33980 [Gemmobacter tilapiae]
MDGKITEKREFVFTEWAEGSTSDMEALRETFDTNHDGVLSGAELEPFKVMVTQADGTVIAQTLGDLGITAINLNPDATHIELPDGSVITGKTTFTQNGVTRMVADTTLSMDAEGHRVVRVESVISGGDFQKEIVNTGYKEDGKIAFVQTTLAKADGSHVRHLFDDNGDGVVDRRQDIKTSVVNGVKTEWVVNRVNDSSDENNAFSVVDRTKTVTITSADGNTVTIERDTNGGGVFEVRETRVTRNLPGDVTEVDVTIERLGPNGTVLESVTKTASNNGLTRVETHDSDGAGASFGLKTSVVISDVAGVRTETVLREAFNGADIGRTVEVTSADGRSDTVTEWVDRDRDGDLDLVSTKTVVVTDGADGSKVTTTEVRNGNGGLISKSVGTVSSDARAKELKVDPDGDGDYDVTTGDVVTVVNGVRTQVQTEVHGDGSGNLGKKVEIAADGVTSKTWLDLDGDGVFEAQELVKDVTVGTGGLRTESSWTKAADGTVVASQVSETTADGKHRTTRIDLDGDGDTDRVVSDVTELRWGGSSERVVTTYAANGTTELSKVETTTSADGLTQESVSTVKEDGQEVVTRSTLAVTLGEDGETIRTYVEAAENGKVIQKRVVTESADRQTTTTTLDVNGDGQIDSETVQTVALNGNVTTVVRKLGLGGVEISEVREEVSRNGQDVWAREDLEGDGDYDVKTLTTSVVNADGSVTVAREVDSRNNTDIGRTKTVTSADGLEKETFSDLDMSNAMLERSSRQETSIEADGSRVTTETSFAGGNYATGTVGSVKLVAQETRVSANGLKTEARSDTDGDGSFDRMSISTTVLTNDGSGRKTVTQIGLVGADGGFKIDLDEQNEIKRTHIYSTTEETILVDGEGVRTREQKIDVNGDWSALDGNFDTIVRTVLGTNGAQTEARIEQDRNGGLLWKSEKTTSRHGLEVETRVDANGDGTADAITVENLILNSNGSTTKTTTNYGSVVDPFGGGSETVNSQSVVTSSANGHRVVETQDIDGDGVLDFRTTTVKTVAANGDKVTDVTRDGGDNANLIASETTTTSRTGRSVTVESDLDGNGKNDIQTVTNINADGTKTSAVTYYSLDEVKVAKTISTTSANGLVTYITKDTNGDGDTDIKIHQEKVLQNDGDVLTTTVVDNGRNERLGSITEIKSMDGLQSSVSLDWDGRDGVDWRSETKRVYEGDGDIVDTMISLDGVWNVRAQITSITSGNGLNRYVTTDYDGDHSLDRILDSQTAADGSKIVTTTEFTPGLDVRRETTISTSADGRNSITEIDLNGDGLVDRRSDSTVNLDRQTRTEYAEVNLDGSIGDRIVETKNFNGTEHRFAFDVGGGDSPEFVRETEVSYGAAGEKITTFSESYGDRVVYSAKTITQQNGLKTRVEIDTDGDGTVDAVTVTETTISKKGARTTTSETSYTKEYDNDVRSTSKVWVSADGRETRTNVDYDGNGIDDKTSVLKIGSDGSRIETEKSYDKAGGLIGETVTETSADGLITTISRQGNTQSIIRSAVSDKSYVWKGGNEVGYEKAEGAEAVAGDVVSVWGSGGGYVSYVRTLTQKEVVHEVDAFGIETWRYTERETVNGDVTTTVHSTRIDAEAKARILAEAARIYDAVLDRDMDVAEMEVLVEFVSNGELNRLALVEELIQSDEYETRYGNMSRAEFINQIYYNTMGRGATLAEAAELIGELDDGVTRAEVARDLAERLEHVIVGNGHMSTNNFDVIMNPAVFERSLDRAFVHEQVRRLIDVVYDRKATDNELSVLGGKLMSGTETLADIAQLLLDTEGKLFGGRTTAIDAGMSATSFVRNAFENAFGRLPSETEELRWVAQLDQGRISKAGLVVLFANSIDHFANGNVTLPFENTVANTVRNGTSSNEVLNGNGGQDDMDGRDGADTLNGNDGADRLEGGAGSDSLVGGKGQDRYFWSRGEGSDTIDDNDVSTLTTDTLILTDVSSTAGDFSLERSGNHLLVKIGAYTITVKDRLQDGTKGLGIEALQFSDGVVWDLRTILLNTKSVGAAATAGGAYRDNLKGTSGNDTITGGGGRDTLTGNAGQDRLDGGAAGDRYVWSRGDGNDTIVEGADSTNAIDILELTDVAMGQVFDVLRINGTNDIRIYIDSATGPTITVLNQFNDTVVGGGIERIVFSDGIWTLHDLLRKSNFNDGDDPSLVTGSRYDDLVTGAGGGDTLSSGEGDDTLLGGTGADVLQGGAGGDEYRWNRGDGADTINDWGNRGNGRDELKLLNARSDEVSFQRENNSEDLKIIIDGAHGAILIDQGFFSDSVAGRGIDRIVLSDGVIWDRDDILDRAIAFGGNSGTTLNGTGSRDRLSGGDGNDVIIGRGGADTMVGGDGADTLKGGSGSDLYIWNAETSRGSDRIEDFSDHAGDVDTLRIVGVGGNDVRLRKDGGNLLVDIDVNGGGYDHTITDVSRFDQAGNGGIEIIEFDDGSRILVRGTDLATAEYQGTGDGDLKSGWNYRDLMEGREGNDTLDGGEWGMDTLIGGKGQDLLDGRHGSDDYRWSIGDGNDTINDTGTSTADADRLVIDLDNLTAEDVLLRRLTGADGLRVIIGDEVIRIDQQYLAGGDGKGIESIVLSDGTVWTLEDIYALTRTVGTDETADTLIGTAYRDNIFGRAGGDRLEGAGGADHLYGGEGNDRLFGGAGSDVYHWAIGDGADTIEDGYSSSSQSDILAFDDMTSAMAETGQVVLERTRNDLLVKITAGGVERVITVVGQYDDANPGVGLEGFQFADGVIWSWDDLLEKTNWQASEGDTVVEGSSLRDNIHGRGGNDELLGLGGQDHLYGGAGADTLDGAAGHDTYYWQTGWGYDIIRDHYVGGEDHVDTLNLTGVTAIELVREPVSGSGRFDLLVKVGGSTAIRVTDQFETLGSGQGIERIVFGSDGELSWTLADILANTKTNGTGLADTIDGTGFADNLIGYGGADKLYGGYGQDTLIGGYGADTLDGGAGDDEVDYSDSDASVDVDLARTGDQIGGKAAGDRLVSIEGLIGSNYADLLSGDDAANVFTGGEGNDTLLGRAGFDRLYGGKGNDRLNGGEDSDMLYGGDGADRFVFWLGTGEDTIASFNAAEGDTIEFARASGANGNFVFRGAGSFGAGGSGPEARLVGDLLMIDVDDDGVADIRVTINNFEGSTAFGASSFIIS